MIWNEQLLTWSLAPRCAGEGPALARRVLAPSLRERGAAEHEQHDHLRFYDVGLCSAKLLETGRLDWPPGLEYELDSQEAVWKRSQ